MSRNEYKQCLIRLLLRGSFSVKRLAQLLGTNEEHIKILLTEITTEVEVYYDGFKYRAEKPVLG